MEEKIKIELLTQIYVAPWKVDMQRQVGKFLVTDRLWWGLELEDVEAGEKK